MAIKLDHVIVPSKDKLASAQLFAEIFGLEVKPVEGRFAQVPIDENLTIVTPFTSRMRSSTVSSSR